MARSGGPAGQPLEGRRGVLALHGEEHDVVVGEGELGRVRHHRHRHPHLVVGGPDEQAVGRDGLAVVAPRHEDDVVAVLGQPPADHPADRSRAHHHEPHPARLPRRGDLLRTAGTR